MVIRINDVCLLPLAYLCHVIGSLLVGQSHVIVCPVRSSAACLGRWAASLDNPESVIGVFRELAVCLHLTVVTAGAGAFLLCSAGCLWRACPHTFTSAGRCGGDRGDDVSEQVEMRIMIVKMMVNMMLVIILMIKMMIKANMVMVILIMIMVLIMLMIYCTLLYAHICRRSFDLPKANNLPSVGNTTARLWKNEDGSSI